MTITLSPTPSCQAFMPGRHLNPPSKSKVNTGDLPEFVDCDVLESLSRTSGAKTASRFYRPTSHFHPSLLLGLSHYVSPQTAACSIF